MSYNNVGRSDIASYSTTVEEEFMYYDALEPEFKKLLQHAPISFASKVIYEWSRGKPIPIAVRTLEKGLQTKFPGYVPI